MKSGGSTTKIKPMLNLDRQSKSVLKKVNDYQTTGKKAREEYTGKIPLIQKKNFRTVEEGISGRTTKVSTSLAVNDKVKPLPKDKLSFPSVEKSKPVEEYSLPLDDTDGL